MLALTLREPWAVLLPLGLKQVETRRCLFDDLRHGYFAVHASRTLGRRERDVMEAEPFKSALERFGITVNTMTHATVPRGTILGVTSCLDAKPTEAPATKQWLADLPAHEAAFGDYTPNRWAYRLGPFYGVDDPMIFAKGKLTPFELDAETERRVLVALQWNEDLPAELTSDDLLNAAIARWEERRALGERAADALRALWGRKDQRDTRSVMDRAVDQAVGRG